MPKFALRLSGQPFRRFFKREDGSLLVFGLFLFSTFFLMGGMAVDVMRAENKRTALSQALDRCALNAAALRQTLDPETVVRDCVDRVGLLPQLTDVNVTNGTGQRSVEAIGDYELETFFMGASGIEEIDLKARSVAEQRATNIEIAMVLDVSGSMNSNSRLSGLKTAARNFVSTVLANNNNKISIAMVPYNGQVNLGPALAAKYNITNVPGLTATANVNCVDMPSSVYDNTGISRTLAMPATGYVDAWTTLAGGYDHDNSTRYGSDMANWSTTYQRDRMRLPDPDHSTVWCPPSTTNIVRMPDDNITALHTYINNLTAIGATSINAGMKWGGALLDPQARSVVNEFVDAGVVPPEFRDRPFDYSKRDALKIILLLSDGENFGDVRVGNSYRTGPSTIFKGTDGNYSVRHVTGRPSTAGTNEYWVPHRNNGAGEWRAQAWGGSTSTTTTTPMTWQQVWQEMNVSWVTWNLYARPLGGSSATNRVNTYNTWWNNFRSQRGSSTSTPAMDEELDEICDATKQEGVLIYSVAFSAPTRGVTTLRNCASSDGHFFNSTNNTALNAAFQAIATNITQLRLVN